MGKAQSGRGLELLLRFELVYDIAHVTNNFEITNFVCKNKLILK